jgi:sterol desaturase/sphingolipid hydroxylase (fatty acid hydroxylase superfamily)
MNLLSHFRADLTLQLIMVAMFFVIGFLFEAIIPSDRSLSGRGILFNCLYAVFFTAFNVTGVALVTLWLNQAMEHIPWRGLISFAWLSDRGSWLLSLPLVLFSMLLRDFFRYWFHRLQHTSKWLWAEHELHHSDDHMNVTTSGRHHWLEFPLQSIFISAPMILLFRLPVVTVIGVAVLMQAMDYFIHLNARISFGAFNRVLATPQVHRIHHSRLPEHMDKNFAAYFPIWDIIFGTYHHPAKGEYPPSGLASGRTVYSVPYAIIMPFVTWTKMLRG